MTCRELVALLTAYLEDVLPRAEREGVEAHLQACPDCTVYVEQVRTTIGALTHLREENVPQPVLDELVEAFVAGSRDDA